MRLNLYVLSTIAIACAVSVTSVPMPGGDQIDTSTPTSTYPSQPSPDYQPLPPQQVYTNPPPPETLSYPTVSNQTISMKDVEQRAHSVHSAYKKELPYEYKKPSERIEVETFDPFSYDSGDDTTTTTSAPNSSEEKRDIITSVERDDLPQDADASTEPDPSDPDDSQEADPFAFTSSPPLSSPEEYTEPEPSTKPNFHDEPSSLEVNTSLLPPADTYEEMYTKLPQTTTEEPPITSFLQAFDKILVSADNYRTSLTQPLRLLVEDSSGRKGVVTCKLQRTRLVITKAVKVLLESYSHWVKLGTTIEESHCRQDSKDALVAFSTQVDKVGLDLTGMEDIDLDDVLETPNIAFKRLQQVVISTLLLFGPGPILPSIHYDSEEYSGHVGRDGHGHSS